MRAFASAYWLIVRTHGRSRPATAAAIDWLLAEGTRSVPPMPGSPLVA